MKPIYFNLSSLSLLASSFFGCANTFKPLEAHISEEIKEDVKAQFSHTRLGLSGIIFQIYDPDGIKSVEIYQENAKTGEISVFKPMIGFHQNLAKIPFQYEKNVSKNYSLRLIIEDCNENKYQKSYIFE